MEIKKVRWISLCHVAHLRAAAVGAEIPAHGECEFCAGGSQHEEISDRHAASPKGNQRRELGRIRKQLLPISNNSDRR